MSAEDDGEVGSRGEADDADVGGVDVPLGRVGAGEAHGLLGVFEVFGVGGVVGVFRDSVFDKYAGHAERVKPVADFGAFDAPGEADVGTAGKDEGGGMGVFCGVGRVNRKRGMGNVGDADGGFAGDHAVFVGGGIEFGAGEVGGLGVAVGPEERGVLGDGGGG